MKTMKRLTAIVLCVLVLACSVPIMVIASGNRDFNIGRIFDSMLKASDNPYSVKADGESFYLYNNGKKVTEKGLHYDGTDYYYVLEDATLAHGKKLFAYDNNDLLEKAYYYFEDDCKMRKNGWLDMGEGMLHYEDGIISKGLTKIDNDYYFFEINRGYLLKDQTIFVDDENKYLVKPGNYTFDSNGKMTVTPEILPDLGKDATATGIVMRSCFSDNMILQRDQKLSVWGKADPDSGTVIVEFAGKTARAEVSGEGTWKATFDEPFGVSKTKRKLKIHGGDKDVILRNILVGDVYYVIGQSNVHYSMQEQTQEMAAHGMNIYWDYNDSRNIRFYRNSALYTADLTGPYAQGTVLEFTEIMVPYEWMKPSDVQAYLGTNINQNSGHRAYSALGYLFAYGLSEKTNVPIGIIEIDAAGMPITAFAPNHLAQKWGDEDYDPDTGIYTFNPRGILTEKSGSYSRFAYNQLIHPLKDFATAGIVWYQGESDAINERGAYFGDDGKTYAYQFAELMEFYRDTLGGGQYDFPIYMIELPTNYYNNGLNIYIDYGPLRAEQGRIPDLLSNTHLVNSADFFTDIAYTNTLHPYIKDKQAQRLAKIVAADKYGVGSTSNEEGPRITDIEYTSPTSVTFTYTNVGSGLKQNYGSYVLGFEVWTGDYDANGNKAWYFVTDAHITENNKITINYSNEILAVRYHASTEASYPGFGESFPALSLNLTNSNGIPASAFVDIKK